MALPAELANLPPPSLVDLISYEARYSELRTKLAQLFTQAGLPYNADPLEVDPAQILLQDAAYIDMGLRQRINEAIRSWFLAYATGDDLDALAFWYDVTRLIGETDDELKRRIILAIQGRSTGGTEPRYRAVAIGADLAVADAAVYTIGRDPTIHVAIFSKENGGVASPALVAKVDAALQDPDVRMVNDTIVVESAAQQTINIEARYWLLPQAPENTDDLMEASLRAAWAADMLLGRDMTISWLTSKLQVDGVQKVIIDAPASDQSIEFNRAAALGSITLTKVARAY